jgi:hypothetical protein
MTPFPKMDGRCLLRRDMSQVAHRVKFAATSTSVAFGAKQTLTQVVAMRSRRFRYDRPLCVRLPQDLRRILPVIFGTQN